MNDMKELFNPTTAMQDYADMLADLDPEEGAVLAERFTKELRTKWIPVFAAVRRSHVRELRREHTMKEIAEMMGVSEARIWQIVEG